MFSPSSSSFHCSVRLGRGRRRVRFSRIRVHASSFWTLERFLPHVFADERGEQRTNERTNGAVFWGMAERRHLLPASLQAPGFASKQPIPYIEWEAVGWNAGGGQISAVLEKKERMTQGMCEKSGTDGRTTRNDGPARPLHSGIEMFPSRLRYGMDRRAAIVMSVRSPAAALLMAPFTRFQFDVATNKISWQLWPRQGRKEARMRREGWRAAGGFAFFRVGGRCFAPPPSLPPSFPPCPVGEMPGESDGLSPPAPAPASRKDGRSE